MRLFEVFNQVSGVVGDYSTECEQEHLKCEEQSHTPRFLGHASDVNLIFSKQNGFIVVNDYQRIKGGPENEDNEFDEDNRQNTLKDQIAVRYGKYSHFQVLEDAIQTVVLGDKIGVNDSEGKAA